MEKLKSVYLWIRILLLPFLLQARTILADYSEIISADRRIEWKAGIPGGIPNYPVGVNVKDSPYNAKGDGIADDWQAITNAIAACPNGQAVYIPTGVYRINKALLIQKPKSIVLRGDGPTKTKLISYNSESSHRAAIVISMETGNGVETPVTGGMQKGSTNLTVQSASGFAVGDYVRITQQNDPAVVLGTLPSNNPYQGQYNQIITVVGNVVGLVRPLYYSYNARFSPILYKSRNQTSRCGIEDLFIEMRGTANNNFFLFLVSQSWIKNVESYNSNFSHVDMSNCFQCEIRDSKFNYHLNYDSNTRYAISMNDFTTDSLAENNITDAGNLAVTVQNGATGNIISYNYSLRGYGNEYPNGGSLAGLMANHGGNANLNLFEGNVIPAIGADNFWGSNARNTFFRNYIRRYSVTNESNTPSIYSQIAVWNDAQNYYMNYVGNILTQPKDAGDTNSNHAVWYIGRDRNRTSTRNNYANPSSPIDDPLVEQTMLRHGNFDYVSGTTQWDPLITTRVLPSSLYLSSKPPWFGSIPWPPIGPDILSKTNKIPAEICYEQGKMPSCVMLGSPPEDEISPSQPGNLRMQ